DHQGEGLLRQRQHLLKALGLSHLLVQVFALLLGALTLPTRFPIQSSPGQLHPSKSLDEGTGLGGWHFAADQRRHLLHPRRGATFLTQTQGIIGGKTPRPATPTPTPQPPDRHRTKSSLIG